MSDLNKTQARQRVREMRLYLSFIDRAIGTPSADVLDDLSVIDGNAAMLREYFEERLAKSEHTD